MDFEKSLEKYLSKDEIAKLIVSFLNEEKKSIYLNSNKISEKFKEKNAITRTTIIIKKLLHIHFKDGIHVPCSFIFFSAILESFN